MTIQRAECRFHARTPEEIEQSYTSLTLEQVYASILYYLQNKEAIEQYMTSWIEHGEQMRKQQVEKPSPFTLRMRALKEEKASA